MHRSHLDQQVHAGVGDLCQGKYYQKNKKSRKVGVLAKENKQALDVKLSHEVLNNYNSCLIQVCYSSLTLILRLCLYVVSLSLLCIVG